jgi:16S rRNA (adenine1518-N6/adenine1519-N6)-dimethyltransferase
MTERDWLRRHGIRPRRGWGQCFLINPRIPERLVTTWNLDAGTGVLEIGAGAGALTLPLLGRGLTVVAVERDMRLCELLRERAAGAGAPGFLRVVEQDILDLDPGPLVTGVAGPELSVVAEAPDRWVVVGNLPYAITSPILEWTVRHREHFAWAAFMVQREVAARLLAGPGCRAYGSLTVWLGYHFRVEKEIAVGAANFWPMPKVESAVVRLWPHGAVPVEVPSAEALERVVRAAFSHRRKVIGGSLSMGLAAERGRIEAALRAVGIDPRRRAESCALEEFAALTRELAAACLLPSENSKKEGA